MHLQPLTHLTILFLFIITLARPLEGGPVDQSCKCNSHSFKCKTSNEIDSPDDSTNEEPVTCVECKHFTTGKNCELCLPMYYRDITKPLHHPEVCLPCMCNVYGSIDNGLCDRFNDETRSLTAGQCHCKANVEGRACDQCKLGYYNFMNEKGCEACECDLDGSYAPYCNPISGQCPCKPNATGRRCEIAESRGNYSASHQSSDSAAQTNTKAPDEITTSGESVTSSEAGHHQSSTEIAVDTSTASE